MEHIIILAAGYGSRMKSQKSKAAQVFAGKPLIKWAYDLARTCQPKFIHVVHNDRNQTELAPLIPYPEVLWIKQEKICGTGDALRCALENILDGHALVIYVDMPLIESDHLNLLSKLDGDVKLLTAEARDPTGYGRVIRTVSGEVQQIIEQMDLSKEQQSINEVFTGILSAPVDRLKAWLNKIDNKNAQGEFLLTDIVKCAVDEKSSVKALKLPDDACIAGVNTMSQLVKLEKHYFKKRAEDFLAAGVKIEDPDRFVCTGEVEIGRDTVIERDVRIHGPSQIGSSCMLRTGCILENAQLGDASIVHPYSYLKHTFLAANTAVGPYAYCREGTVLADHAEIGAFVETKQAYIGHYSKAKHLSYLGDIDIGRHVNVGAGTIVCNYDGQKKHKTIIGNHVFVGSDVQLVAPLNIKDYAFVAAGTCVTEDVQENQLAIGRSRQENKKKSKKIAKSHTEIENL